MALGLWDEVHQTFCMRMEVEGFVENLRRYFRSCDSFVQEALRAIGSLAALGDAQARDGLGN